MDTILIVVLIGGFYLGYRLTKFINWYTFGRNRARKKARLRRKDDEG